MRQSAEDMGLFGWGKTWLKARPSGEALPLTTALQLNLWTTPNNVSTGAPGGDGQWCTTPTLCHLDLWLSQINGRTDSVTFTNDGGLGPAAVAHPLATALPGGTGRMAGGTLMCGLYPVRVPRSASTRRFTAR